MIIPNDKLEAINSVRERKDIPKLVEKTGLSINAIRGVQLRYFTEEGLINRRGTAKGGYVYYIPELTKLRDRIKVNPDLVPTPNKR